MANKKNSKKKKVSRIPVKVVSNKLVKFIPDIYDDLDEKAENMCDRPLIAYGRKLTRDERTAMDECIVSELPPNFDRKKPGDIKKIKVTGKGDAYKFVFDTCIKKLENVLIQEEDNPVEEIKRMEGEDLERYWNTHGDEAAILQIIDYFISISNFTKAESKN